MSRISERRDHVRQNRRKYAAIGFIVTKFVMPIVKKQAKKNARKAAKGTASSAAGAVKRHPARTSVAVGTVVGAAGWLMTRGRRGGGSDETDVAE